MARRELFKVPCVQKISKSTNKTQKKRNSLLIDRQMNLVCLPVPHFLLNGNEFDGCPLGTPMCLMSEV